MSNAPTHSQLPLASVRTHAGVTIAPRLDLDDVQLPEAIARVLARRAKTPARVAQALLDLTAAVPDTLDARVVNSWLMLIDLSAGNTALGGSLLVQALLPDTPQQLEPAPPAVGPAAVHALQQAVRALASDGAILAARWRGSAGLIGCLVALAGPGSPDVAVNIDPLLIEGFGDGRMDSGEAKNWTTQVSGLRHERTLRALFNEAPGLVLQVADAQRAAVLRVLRENGLGRYSHFIAHLHARGADAAADPAHDRRFSIWRDTQSIFSRSLPALQQGGDSPTVPR